MLGLEGDDFARRSALNIFSARPDDEQKGTRNNVRVIWVFVTVSVNPDTMTSEGAEKVDGLTSLR